MIILQKIKNNKEKVLAILSIIVSIALISLLVGTINNNDFWIGEYKYHFFLKSFDAHISGYRGDGKTVVIPEKIGPFKVQHVEYDVFNNNDNIEKVFIPDYQDSKQVFFMNCRNLKEVECGENLNFLAYNFNGCSNLEEVKLPEGLEVVVTSFYECKSLKNIIIPKSVKDMQLDGFMGTEFKKDHLKDKYYVAGDGCLIFYNGSEDTDIVIPNGIKNVCVILANEKIKINRNIYFAESLTIAEDIMSERDTVFYGGEDFERINLFGFKGTIVAPAGSPMETYCKENDIKFRPMTDEEEKIWRGKTEAAASEITYQE